MGSFFYAKNGYRVVKKFFTKCVCNSLQNDAHRPIIKLVKDGQTFLKGGHDYAIYTNR